MGERKSDSDNGNESDLYRRDDRIDRISSNT